jgi:hypothetical protein
MVDWRNEKSVCEAAHDLNNDEQVDAALKLGLFSSAFCFNNQHANASCTCPLSSHHTSESQDSDKRQSLC